MSFFKLSYHSLGKVRKGYVGTVQVTLGWVCCVMMDYVGLGKAWFLMLHLHFPKWTSTMFSSGFLQASYFSSHGLS